MKRTPLEAKREADSLPIEVRPYTAEADAAIAEAATQGQDFLDHHAEELEAEIREAQEFAAVDVRDGLAALRTAGQSEAVTVTLYSAQYTALDEALEGLVAERAELARRIDVLEQVEADPAKFTDNLYVKFPALRRPDFSF